MNNKYNWDKINQPVEVDVKTAQSDKYIFNKQFQQLSHLCQEYIDRTEVKQYKVISIEGERGMGKTSLLKTFKNQLEDCDNQVIGPIDPSALDNSMGIIEILLSEIHSDLTSSSKVEKLNQYMVAQLHEQIRSCVKTLATIRLEKVSLIEMHSTVEVLEIYKNSVDFEKTLKDFFQAYLELIDKKNLIIMIDDLDLVDSQVIYKMTEDIRKYFSNSITVVMAYRESQLFNAIMQQKIGDNRILLDSKTISIEEIREQTAKYLEKFAPLQYKVCMYSPRYIYKESARNILENVATVPVKELEILKEMEQDKNISEANIEDFIAWLTEKRTGCRIIPNDVREQDDRRMPTSIRGLLNLCKVLISDMEQPQGQCITNQARAKVKNINIYRQFCVDYYNSILPFNYINIIHQWERGSAEVKNYKLIDNLFREFIETDVELKNQWIENKNLNYTKIQPYNIGLADIYLMLEELKNIAYKEEHMYLLVYSLKLLYSLLLTEQYLMAVINYEPKGENLYLQNYLSILNCYVIPDTIVADYEQEFKPTFEFIYNPDEKKHVDALVDKTCYLTVTSKGDIIKGARSRYGENNTNIPTSYIYREIFNANIGKGEMIKNRHYSCDPFGFLGKKNYVEATLEKWNSSKDKAEENYTYVLLSMFDIGYFLHKNYKKRNPKDAIKYFFNAINNAIANKENNGHGVRKNLSLCPPALRYDSTSDYTYEQPLSDVEIETICGILNPTEKELIDAIKNIILIDKLDKAKWTKAFDYMAQLTEIDKEKYPESEAVKNLIPMKSWKEEKKKQVIQEVEKLVKNYESSR